MSASLPLNSSSSCCQPSCLDVAIAQVPGPDGSDGENGASGIDGQNAYSTTSAGFVQPAVSGSASVEMLNSDWAVLGQVIILETAGWMRVDGITDSTHLTLINLGYPTNAAPGTNIAPLMRVSPGGERGATGASGAGTLNDLSPTHARGDILIDDGSMNPDANLVRFGVGANGTLLHADSGQPVGARWSGIDLGGTSTTLTGKVPVAKGGTGSDTAVLARTALGCAASGLATASGLTTSATDKLLGRSTAGAGAVEEITCTPFIRTLLDDADAATARTTLGVQTLPLLVYQNQQTSGTGGGAFNSGAWTTVPLTTEVIDTGGNGSIAANVITLAAGTYRYRAWVSGYAVDGFQARLFNVDTASVIGIGLNALAPTGQANTSFVTGRFTIGVATQIRLEAQCVTSNGTDGFGKANSFGTEIYSSIEFDKE